MANRRIKWLLIVLAIVCVAVVALYIYYQNTQRSKLSNRAYIDYWIETNGTTRFYYYDQNTIWASCRNGGDRVGSFFLTITFINATIATDQPYILNERSARIDFVLSGKVDGELRSTRSIPIKFYIDQGVSGFSATIKFELRDYHLPTVSNPISPQILQADWNEEYKWFELAN